LARSGRVCMCGGKMEGNGAPGNNKQKPILPKNRGEFIRNQRKDSEGFSEAPDLEFEYADSDKWAAELSELYSYTEGPEFQLNRKCFEEDFQTHVEGKRWVELDAVQHRAHAMRLLDGLDVTGREKRLKVARAILYMAQGTFSDCGSEAEVQHWIRYNVFLLLDVGTFTALVELLNMEIENSAACSSAVRKPAISLADSTDLRVLLNIMYLMVETIQQDDPADPPEWRASRETFKTELGSPLYNSEPVSVMLFAMVTKFCSGHAPHFPMKKVLLLLWKTILFTLGGFEQLQRLKVCKRVELGLPRLPEDSISVIRSMRAASPPASASDLIEQQQNNDLNHLILSNLTKKKHKKALKVKQAMMQLYVLKLLKVQTKYLGRQWRKSNMKTMSAIYQKVRHRLNDDWAYGNDLDARPWDFQAEECSLRASIERFNSRRYDKAVGNPEFSPVDNCLQSVLGQKVELPDDFQMNYDLWLEREVFSKPICWEELLQ
uniref:Striatin interacting protein 1 n=1 Tax=Astyanax mexicanus TaxID=7994 RepID=A0A8B9GR96_ASTMX